MTFLNFLYVFQKSYVIRRITGITLQQDVCVGLVKAWGPQKKYLPAPLSEWCP